LATPPVTNRALIVICATGSASAPMQRRNWSRYLDSLAVDYPDSLVRLGVFSDMDVEGRLFHYVQVHASGTGFVT
jgi:hypothetical protein